MKKLTYKKSGVDTKKAAKFIKDITPLVKQTKRFGVLKDIGSFGGFFSFLKPSLKHPVLVSSSDGVGTKIKIAILANIHDSVGIDLVAMNVNDVLCSGAQPLFFLDYISCCQIQPKTFKSIIKGIVNGCKQADCALLGGETAEMPGMYKKGDYDLAGFCVGVVERDKIIRPNKVSTGDVVLGIASSGLHSNGFSLVRKIFNKAQLLSNKRELLKPTRIYVRPVLKLLKEFNPGTDFKIKGIAHITGGSFYDKASRIVPKGKTILIKKGSWPIPKIFKAVAQKGKVQEKEMFHTFNMGIGMVLILDKRIARKALNRLRSLRFKSWIIGEIVKGKGKVTIA